MQSTAMDKKRATAERLSPPAPTSPGRVKQRPVFWVAGAAMILGCITWAVARFGAIGDVYTILSGETLSINSNSKSFGTAAPGDQVEVAFEFNK